MKSFEIAIEKMLPYDGGVRPSNDKEETGLEICLWGIVSMVFQGS